MPCSDDRTEDVQQVKINSLTRMLCAVTRRDRGDTLDTDQQAALHDAQSWLVKHDEADRVRVAREVERANEEALRKSVWEKLTPEERRALRLERSF